MSEIATVEMKENGKSFFNDIGLRLAHKILGLEYLHYGYFENLTKNLESLPKAQEQYMEKVLSQIPTQVKNILDIGCGAGGMAKNMIQRGYNVTCCEPDPFLLNKTLAATNNKIKGVIGFYQTVQDLPPTSFDLILMSESCQYVPYEVGFQQHSRFLKEGGFVLIADFFIQKPLDQKYLSKSGHPYQEFLNTAKKYNFELIKNIDITPETAPTMDIYQDLIHNKAFPIIEAVFEYLYRKTPLIYKFLNFLIGKKILFLKQKYSSQSAEIFTKYKTYRILLFQKSANKV